VSRNYQAKRLAQEQGISYAEALRRVRTGAVTELPSLEQRLLAEVKRECWELVGEKVAYRIGRSVVAGAHFADELRLPSPPRIERMRVHVMDTDYSTLRWEPVEVVPGIRVGGDVMPGVQSGYLTVESRVGFRCVMKTSDPIEDPTPGFPDDYVDEEHVLVSIERDVLLRWHAVLVDGADPDLIFGCGEPRTALAPLYPAT
jgi:hypothetical protein